jgi:DNA polymerase I
MRKPVYIVDAMNHIFRAYYALPRDIHSPSGMLTNAVFGYARTLLRLIRDHKPEYLVSVFEGDTSFRNALFSDYKANRAEHPADLEPQVDSCRRVTQAIGVPYFQLHDYEADDLIGTIAVRMWQNGHSVVIVTGDKDMSQLVRTGISVYDMGKGVWFDEARVREKFGVAPGQIPELLSLLGDSVDNIPGVFGVGEKTARQILSICSCVEDLVHSDAFDDRFTFRSRTDILRRIRTNIDSVRLSRKLATICCDAPITVNADTVRYRRAHRDSLDPVLKELGLKQIAPDVPLAQPTLF